MYPITNIRLGFATNSSSSHSVVIAPSMDALSTAEDHACGPEDSKYYGWDNFVLTGETKIPYIAAQIEGMLDGQGYPEVLIHYIMDSVFPHAPRIETDGIDHQSQMSTPGRLHLPIAFYQDIARFLQHPRVVILGGNDNDEDSEPPFSIDGWAEGPPIPRDSGNILGIIDHVAQARYARTEHGWIIFNGHNGNKIRLHLNPDVPASPLGTFPELVDIKITDWCPFGCSFCYQSSTKDGLHAPMDRIEAALDTLAAAGTFEIAIGGGEPTMHPQFADILYAAYRRGIRPNFTTYSTAWLRDEAIVDAVRTCVGGIGVSVHSPDAMGTLDRILEAFPQEYDTRPRVMAQHAIGTVAHDALMQILDALKERYVPFLMLGYKTAGFGAQHTPHPLDWNALTKYLKKAWMKISVDTAMVEQHGAFVQSIARHNTLIGDPEGARSCYIDAVTDTMAPSSYGGEQRPMVYDTEAFLSTFRALQPCMD